MTVELDFFLQGLHFGHDRQHPLQMTWQIPQPLPLDECPQFADLPVHHRRNPERHFRFRTIVDQFLVTRFKDVQVQFIAGKNHCGEGEAGGQFVRNIHQS